MRSIDYFDKMVRLQPHRDILISGDTRYSYGEMHTLSHRLAGAMHAVVCSVRSRWRSCRPIMARS